MPTHQDVADRWVEGLQGDWSTLEELSAPTMRVWHSFDNIWLERGEAGGAARTHIVQVLTVVDGMIAACEEYVAPEIAP